MKHCIFCGGKLDKLTETEYKCEVCKRENYNNPVACTTVIILNDSRDQVLMAVRGVEPEKGKLDLPGGFVEVDEEIETAMRREVREETGLEVNILGMLGAYTNHYMDDRWTADITYVVTIKSGEPAAADDVAELHWYKIDEIPDDQIAFESIKKEFKDLKIAFARGEYGKERLAAP